MKLRTEQARMLLEAEPFVIFSLVIDDEGYQDFDFAPTLIATNAWWDDKGLTKFVRDEINEQELGSELCSCHATYLCNLERGMNPPPNEGAFWWASETVLLKTEPFEIDNYPELDSQLDELERQAEDWGKTVDYLLAHAPDPEPDYEMPEASEDCDDEDTPHYDTPLGL